MKKSFIYALLIFIFAISPISGATMEKDAKARIIEQVKENVIKQIEDISSEIWENLSDKDKSYYNYLCGQKRAYHQVYELILYLERNQ